VSPIPTEGRPADFMGAVGDYQFVFNASPTKVKIGDPVTVRMDINGTGNFNTVLMPKFESTSGFKTYEPQVKTEENRKSFTQVMIPESDTVTQIPKATFVYFDPIARQFKSITQGPLAIQVDKGKEEAPSQVIGPGVQAPAPAKDNDLGRDIIYIKESPGIWFRKGKVYYKTKAFFALIILPMICLVAFNMIQRRHLRFKNDSAYADRILAFKSAKKGVKDLNGQLRSGDPKIFYETLFKTLQNYLGHRLHIPPAGVTSNTAVQGLVSREIDPAIVSKVGKLFETCDMARFAYLHVDDYKMRDDKKELEEVLKYFEHKRL